MDGSLCQTQLQNSPSRSASVVRKLQKPIYELVVEYIHEWIQDSSKENKDREVSLWDIVNSNNFPLILSYSFFHRTTFVSVNIYYCLLVNKTPASKQQIHKYIWHICFSDESHFEVICKIAYISVFSIVNTSILLHGLTVNLDSF